MSVDGAETNPTTAGPIPSGNPGVVGTGNSTLLGPPAGLADEQLAADLTGLLHVAGDVRILANAYTAAVFHRPAGTAVWQLVVTGEFATESIKAVKALGARLTWGRVDGLPWAADPATALTAPITSSHLNTWLKEAKGVTSGRKGEVTPSICEDLVYLAGWRCQFAGCGKDLRRHTATGSPGRFTYFAHIVAASPEGPRGDPVLSPKLARDPSNFMLLCDECHRRIDKIDPARFTVEVLRRMRENSIAEVRRLLNTLQYPAAETIALIGNIAGQPAQFSLDEAHEALWGAKLRTENTKPERYFSPGGQHYDVHTPAYWTSLFQQLKSDLPVLQAVLAGTRSGTARPKLAIFPQHITSVLVLAGRVLGDSAGTYLFQPHRNAMDDRPRWAWPADAPAPEASKYRVRELRPHADEEAACLLVTLTADIERHRLPATCVSNDALLLPTLQVTGPAFDKDCIQHPNDLKVLGRAIDEAMRILQDEWRVRTVHLFVCAPASAAVVVGQKMQARHHANYVSHEALNGRGAPYVAAIELSSTRVRELVSGQGHSHPLQA